MSSEVSKLNRIKKSTGVAHKVISVLIILAIVAFVLCLAGGIICFVEKDEINKAYKEGKITDDNITMNISVSMFEFDVKDMVDVNDNNLGQVMSGVCFFAAFIVATVLGVFVSLDSIVKEIIASETPFTENVMKRLKFNFIFITVLILLVSGGGMAVVTALVFWVIYTIFDYGYELQIQADETI